jgi:hypothetical protein
MLSRHGDKLTATYAEEDRVVADFESFSRYFERMMTAIPRFIRRRALAPLVFEVRDASGRRFWRIDPALGQIRELPAPSARDVIFEVHAAVLRDCCHNRMFSVWSASKRLKIKLPAPQSLAVATRWLTFLDLYELETFPLGANLSPRSLAVRLRRWREPVELATLMLRRALGRRPLTIASLYPIRAA